MFCDCTSLEDLDVSNFKFKKDTEMNCMFSGCSEDLKNKIKNQNKDIKGEAFEKPYSPIII